MTQPRPKPMTRAEQADAIERLIDVVQSRRLADVMPGANNATVEQAYRLGINVIYYAFNEYHRIHFE